MTTLENQKGISLIITFFIMIIILVIVLSVSLILYSEIKVIRNIGNSMVSFYAADSGIEKVLYYDRQVLLIRQDEEGNDILVPRGLCFMLDSANLNYCREAEEGVIYCKDPMPAGLIGGCNKNICDNCTISFNTTFDQRSYSVEATVNSEYYLYIASSGIFGEAGRKIEITSLLEP